MLKRDGWTIGRNLVYRLYREERLALRSKLSIGVALMARETGLEPATSGVTGLF
jgi:hypothetical protein